MATSNSGQPEQMLQLPILKHFNPNELTIDPNKWRGGEKPLMSAIALAILAGAGYMTWTYVLPPVFQALGQLMAGAATVVGVVGLVFMTPVILKGLRRITRFFHKLLIKYDPFGELDEQRQKMLKNRESFKQAKAKIKALKNNMESEAAKSEQEAKQSQEQVLILQNKAEKLKTQLEQLSANHGAAAKDMDEYVDIQAQLMKVLSEAQRVSHLLQQSSSFVQKYGVRANVMGKLDRKLTMVQTAMDIKISDFDVSIDMLKKEYAFAETARNATEQAKSAMGFTKGWELDYALDVVTSTIAMDIAVTQENLSDIDTLTSQYSVDSDELFSKLDVLSDRIKTGDYQIPEARQYNNPNYKPSAEDRAQSGGFGDMF